MTFSGNNGQCYYDNTCNLATEIYAAETDSWQQGCDFPKGKYVFIAKTATIYFEDYFFTFGGYRGYFNKYNQNKWEQEAVRTVV